MAKQIVPNTGRDIIVSMNYDPTGLAWVECFDNAPLGWAVDDIDPSHPEPVVVGSLPPASADTAPVMSPVWAQYTGGFIVVPDVVRMVPAEFFTWLATNNGATREVRSSMKSTDLNQAFHQWGGGAPGTPGAMGIEAPLPEGAYAPGRLAPSVPAAGGKGINGDHDRLGAHPEGHPVDPMRSSDLGDTGEHRGTDKAPAGKPSEPKSPPHPNHGRDEHHRSR